MLVLQAWEERRAKPAPEPDEDVAEVAPDASGESGEAKTAEPAASAVDTASAGGSYETEEPPVDRSGG